MYHIGDNMHDGHKLYFTKKEKYDLHMTVARKHRKQKTGLSESETDNGKE
jgi:hypothetical protein